MSQDNFKKIVNQFESIYLSDLYDQEDSPDGIEGDIYWDDIMERVHADNVNYGASKAVFWFDELSDYVIKIPIMGDYDSFNEDYRDYTGAHFSLDTKSDYEDWDYCAAEESVYNYIKTHNPHLAKFFAAVFYLDSNSHGVPIYAAEKIDRTLHNTWFLETSDNSKHKADEIRNAYGYIGGLGHYAISLFYDQYPENDVNELLNFIIDAGIDDLHGANLGLTNDGKLVIIDYSNFDSQEQV